ncbi:MULTISPECIES: lysylphosphatidylglycerol synthase transmembrane domain-containing protein [unclassified Thermococcus]|uniref:lysylphosphatidylglycerol synthase transmembrane domain-containing protein n=1 Tax=unclassified Thermococcus TaxID=2627626 RepID=UPI001F0D8F02|nr:MULTISPECIES: lysylphosphatidylglycerol synthase transmembrane domain-containing protein [unclassified Thermococcus]
MKMITIGEYTNLLKSLNKTSLELITIALALYYLSTIIYALRWKIILDNMGKNVPLIDLLKAILSSIFVNNVTPMSRGGGEILRVTWISKKYKIPLSLSTVSILYERIMEAFPVTILLFLGVTYFAKHIIYFVSIAIFVVVLIWLNWEKFIKLSVKIIKVKLTAEELISIVSLKQRFSLNILVVGLSSAVWFLDMLRLKLIALAFGWNPSIGLLAIVSLANLIFGLMAFTPGGIGIVEGGLIGTLTYFGIPSTLAVSITLIERFISYVLSSIVGFVTLVVSGGAEIWKALKSH